MFSYAYINGHGDGLEPYRPENELNPETLFSIAMDLEVYIMGTAACRSGDFRGDNPARWVGERH